MGLDDVIVPGGGKADLWQGLNCKGKYAGDLRIELTYYDTRAKPEKGEEIISVQEELRQQYGSLQSKVKRRPLPTNPNAPSTTPVVIPDRAPPGRARHGPRDLQMPLRAGSTPAEALSYPHSAATLIGQTPVHPAAITPGVPVEQASPTQYYGEYESNPDPEVYEAQQPDFLPQLPPSNRQRGAQPRFSQRASQPQLYQHQQQHPPQPRPLSHIGLPHSHSAPAVPVAHEEDFLYDHDLPEALPEADYQQQHHRQRRNDIPPGWEHEFPTHQPYAEDELDGPPPPPVHSNSSPAVPHYGSAHGRTYAPGAARYGTTPPTARHAHMPNSSPIQSIEQGYSPAQPSYGYRNPARGASFDEYGTSPYQHSYESTPNLPSSHQSPSPIGRTPPFRQMPGRSSFAEPNSTPSRPHPLSQQVPRARSPNPSAYSRHELPEAAQEVPQYPDYRGRVRAQSANPRAASPQPPQQPQSAGRPAKNPYSIQFPVRAFASSDANPLSTSQPNSASRPLPNRASAPPMRKSVSPRPSMSEGSGAVPFSPDSFDVHNPQPSNGEGSGARDGRSGPIVGWHGQEIDPSDHLPVDSWAPEPKKKTPTKTYGLGRERDFGPRTVQGASAGAGRSSRDTVLNVRLKAQSQEPEPSRNRMGRKSPGPGRSPNMELPMHEGFDSVPNPYEQPQPPFSRGYRDASRSPGGYGGGSPGGYGSAPPSLPPKVPLNYESDALSREISSIDIGTRQRAPTSFVPVRSHRDRNNFY